MPRVSVIVPVYNVEPYLHSCVDSILEQTYSDLEVILVDDGSPDHCPEICDEYALRDNRVRVIHKKNGGVSAARNTALELVTGDYVTFCDSDDSYAPWWIQSLVSAMEQHQADVVIGHYHGFVENTRMGYVKQLETGVFETPLPEDRVRYCAEKLFFEKHGWEIWRRLFRTDIIREHRIRFCETCENFAEDLGFVLAYTLFTRRVVAIPETGYRYRIRAGSMMGGSGETVKLNAVNEVFLHLIPYLRKGLGPELSERILPVFHFSILYNQYCKMIRQKQYALMKIPEKHIRHYDQWRAYTRQLFQCKQELTAYYERNNMFRALLLAHHCLHGHWWLFRMAWGLVNWFDWLRGHNIIFGGTRYADN